MRVKGAQFHFSITFSSVCNMQWECSLTIVTCSSVSLPHLVSWSIPSLNYFILTTFHSLSESWNAIKSTTRLEEIPLYTSRGSVNRYPETNLSRLCWTGSPYRACVDLSRMSSHVYLTQVDGCQRAIVERQVCMAELATTFSRVLYETSPIFPDSTFFNTQDNMSTSSIFDWLAMVCLLSSYWFIMK